MKQPEVTNTLLGLSAHQLLALIGHAPDIKTLKKANREIELSPKRQMNEQEMGWAKKQREQGVFRSEVDRIEGATLRYYLIKQDNPEKIREVAKQLASITAFLHKNGITHNDLHFQNVLVENKKGRIKLKVIDNETISLLGKPWANIYNNPTETTLFINKPTDQGRDLKIVTDGKVWVNQKLRKEFIETFKKEYERELFDHPMRFRGKPIHEMKPKSPFIRDIPRKKVKR